MNPRERFHSSVNHEEPDRVPLDLWITPQAYENLKDYLGITSPEKQEWGIMNTWNISEEILNRLHIDFRRVYMKTSTNIKSKAIGENTFANEFGCRYTWIGPYPEVVHFPFADYSEVSQVEEYEWLDPEDQSRMEGVQERAKYLHEETDFAIVGMVGGPWGVFEVCAYYMRGFEKFMVDLLTNRKLAEAMMDKAAKLAVEMNAVYLDEVGEYIDLVLVGDDLGHQNGLIMSPEMYRELIKPRHKKIYMDIHKRAPHVKVLFHTCGAIEPLINDLIEVGVDILNPIQPLAKGMESSGLKSKYGERITFHGGVDLQHIMSSLGTIDDLRIEIDTRIKALAPNGGYILAPEHNIQPNSNPQKILEMYDYAEKQGRYPISI